jgi:drug/metabolite transporter (DMT)-like permease
MIPIAVSVIFFNGRLSLTRCFGIILTIIALVLNLDKDEKSANFRKWFLISIAASLSTAAIAVSQQIFGKTQWSGATRTFVACGYMFSAVFSFLIYFILKTKGTTITFKLKPNVFVFALFIGF